MTKWWDNWCNVLCTFTWMTCVPSVLLLKATDLYKYNLTKMTVTFKAQMDMAYISQTSHI